MVLSSVERSAREVLLTPLLMQYGCSDHFCAFPVWRMRPSTTSMMRSQRGARFMLCVTMRKAGSAVPVDLAHHFENAVWPILYRDFPSARPPARDQGSSRAREPPPPAAAGHPTCSSPDCWRTGQADLLHQVRRSAFDISRGNPRSTSIGIITFSSAVKAEIR